MSDMKEIKREAAINLQNVVLNLPVSEEDKINLLTAVTDLLKACSKKDETISLKDCNNPTDEK